jgi:xanthine dehydrogenase accessory factor
MTGDSPSFYEQLVALERTGTAFVFVTLVESLGSTPQDTGAKMLVTAAGVHTGTVGGGRVEARAITCAREMLQQKITIPQFVAWTLKTDVGMTCGGAVKLYFEPHPGAAAAWTIAIFGAGHVVQALLPVLAPLESLIRVFDSREEWLERLPRARNVRIARRDARPWMSCPTTPSSSASRRATRPTGQSCAERWRGAFLFSERSAATPRPPSSAKN